MDQPNPVAVDTSFLAAAPPPDQAKRLAVLRSYGILDTPVEGAFEDITRIASLVCQAPIAVVSLIDEHRQWFKSEIGLGVRETPLDTSFCAHAILQNDFMEIPDALLDPRFNRNPLVTGGPRLRFYAGALIRTAEGHALGTVCVLDTHPRELNEEQRRVLRALSRQVMTHLELRRTLIAAARANRYRGRLMAIAGHDLKQPLTTMTMVLDMLSSEAPGDMHRIEVAKEAAARLRDELDELARASRLDEEGDQIELESVQIDELIVEIAESWSHTAKRKGLSLQLRVVDAEMSTNPGMLRTILDNLIGNAIKYTQRGSITIACRKDDGGLWIDVADTGKGISEDRRDEIFTAFRQLDPDADGLGLGLSIVKSTADMLGYRLNLDCGEGPGTTFSVYLPREPASAQGPVTA
ncbi:MAG: sensor histidine kinase [Rhodanobacteraceae bacterium]